MKTSINHQLFRKAYSKFINGNIRKIALAYCTENIFEEKSKNITKTLLLREQRIYKIVLRKIADNVR